MRFIFPFLLLLTILRVAAEVTPVPAPVTAGQFTELLERPPFRRVLGLSDSLVLSGVASLPQGKMVTIWNRATRESFLVTAKPNAQGWKLESLTGSADLKSIAAVISSGGQSITLRFDPERLTPPKLDNTSKPAARSESQVVVEALLRALDPVAAKSFEGLPPASQETFRKSFAGFLDTYPAASDPQRVDFVRRSLAEVSNPPDPAPVPPSSSTIQPVAAPPATPK